MMTDAAENREEAGAGIDERVEPRLRECTL